MPVSPRAPLSMAGTDGTILFVCSGNICRSPFLELTMRRSLAQHHITSIAVRSAGTDALLRQSVAGPMAEILREDNIDPSLFRSRQLSHQLVASADLILTAERAHRSVAARMHPSAVSRIFTVTQAARLLQAAPPLPPDPALNPVAQLTSLIASGRGVNQTSAGNGDDIADPWQQSRSVYRAVARAMKEPLAVIVHALVAQRTALSHVSSD
ncbi:hypothetical protein C3E77_12250 [Mycetocola zhujimingii]|uniref:Phosphotyrosine protein phosphatase I domain-containing protein n=2 Tax=Mycetocola zhujimingii TaxID=2079792 RepID=A0A2U1TFS7_9MICO|nr:hypothetical protein [Mycetocola zhujimingii]AWB87303.1 hypothetical protein C3E77_12250 [Mycetocola zhujimingii]PWC07742.1 hypothetical protein DF223_04605 [Mycetocola zhujimingii]